MADDNLCAGCHRDDEHNASESWCTDCSEPVCKTCARFHRKLAPPHKVISLNEVPKLSSSLLHLSSTCENHANQKISLFCCQHDTIVCALCVPESHQKCKPIISLENAAKDVRNGSAIHDLERRIETMIERVERAIGMQTQNMSDLKSKKNEIEKIISETKQNIITYLDHLAAKLYKQLETKCKEITAIATKHQSELKPNADRLVSWRSDLKSLKTYSSDILLFQVVKFLDSKLHQIEIKSREDQSAPLSMILFRPELDISKIKNMLPSLGSIEVLSSQISSPLGVFQQAQLFVQPSVKNRKMPLVSSIETPKCGEIFRGCFINGNRLLLSLSFSSNLYACDANGSNSSRINVTRKSSYLTRYIHDQCLVTGENIHIVDHKTLNVSRKIELEKKYARGIAYSDGKIVTSIGGKTIIIFNENGKPIKKILTSFDTQDMCLNKAGEIYCTDYIGSNVYVINFEGVARTLYSSKDLKFPLGLDVDDSTGNVYVAGKDSNNIHQISGDGNTSSIILTKEDGIDCPFGVSFDNVTRQLMVINNKGRSIHIYKVD